MITEIKLEYRYLPRTTEIEVPLYDVYVQQVGQTEMLFVATTSAEWGEVIASLQVLFPAMIGVTIEEHKPDDKG